MADLPAAVPANFRVATEMALTCGFTFSGDGKIGALRLHPLFTPFAAYDLRVCTLFTPFSRFARRRVYAYRKAYTHPLATEAFVQTPGGR